MTETEVGDAAERLRLAKMIEEATVGLTIASSGDIAGALLAAGVSLPPEPPNMTDVVPEKPSEADRLMRMAYPDGGAGESPAEWMIRREMAERVIAAGVPIPPEPTTRWSGGGSILRWDDWAIGVYHETDMKRYPDAHSLAQRLCRHLNATGFTPEDG